MFRSLVLVAWCGLLILNSGVEAVRRRPNLLFILTDDLGYGEINQSPEWGFPLDALNPNGGTPLVRKNNSRILLTPNMERFAREGIRATMSYAPSSVCGPSRASIFSEMQIGAIDIRSNRNIGTVEMIGSNLAGDLTDSGYRTAYFGKWGLGRVSGGPWNQGFGRYVGQLTHNEAHVYFPEFIYKWDKKSQEIPSNLYDVNGLQVPVPGNIGMNWNDRSCPLNATSTCTYVNDIVRNETFAFMLETPSVPFYAVWAPTYPHSGVYSKGSRQISPVPKISPWRLGNSIESQSVRGHASQIEMALDGDVGLLLDLLASRPQMDNNTLIIFSSDNGAQQDSVTYTVGYFKSTGGLRGEKRMMFEGGLRVPTMVRYKGVFPAGIISRVPHALYDVGPTFREAAGLPPKIFVGKKNNAPSGTASMFKHWSTGKECDAPNRTWLHFEICPPSNFKDVDCQMSTIDLSTWRVGPVPKIIVSNRRRTKIMFNLFDDPTEKKPWKYGALFNEIWSWKKWMRYPLDWNPAQPKTG